MAYQPQPNKRQLQHSATLEKIRSAMDRLAEEKGMEHMTIRDICREANITVGTLYHYFPSKTALLTDRSVRTNEHFIHLYQQELQGLPPLEVLGRIAEDYFAYNRSRVFPILVEFMKAKLENKGGEFETAPLEEIAAEVLAQGQQAGTIRRDFTPQSMASLYWAHLNGITTQYCASGGQSLNNEELLPLTLEFIRCTFSVQTSE